ncbi:ankyrin repeat domain-containing protein [Bacillus cereus]|uniref:ankyrin repeat domain-containing protein n=1 Tax=Bacillus cereus TaxID=1396 RepID=UPI001F477FA0|nr:ankyrin repeat domain-containing protein [Bacillus cereus]UJA81059.1 ankyrin repeat domain-containing protein [Bacillus cereus]
MRILNVFDAVREGAFEDFKKIYDGDINQIDSDLDINLLCMALTNNKNSSEKLKIIKFLLEEGIDINYTTAKDKRNALHMFYFCVLRPTIEYELEITRLLIDNKININALDKYNAISLKYAITINKLPTEDNKDMYKLLINSGSNYNLKDQFGKSCVDYAKEYSWRNDLLTIIEEC